MGIEYSTFNIIGSTLEEEITTTTHTDGSVVKSKKRNPWVAGVVTVCVTGIFLTYMDGGKGMISKSFGKVCQNCSKNV